MSKIQQVLKVCEIQEKLQSSRQSFNTPAADDLTTGIAFACLTSFDVDSTSPSFIVRRWSVLASPLQLSASTLAPLQRAQNVAARLALGLDRRSHITTALQKLHWLPVKYRVTFKIATIMHQTFHRRCPLYLSDLIVFASADSNVRQLRSFTTRTAAVCRKAKQDAVRKACLLSGRPRHGTVSPPPTVPLTPTQPSVVPSRHICSAQHLTISFYLDIHTVMRNRSIFNLYDWAL